MKKIRISIKDQESKVILVPDEDASLISDLLISNDDVIAVSTADFIAVDDVIKYCEDKQI